MRDQLMHEAAECRAAGIPVVGIDPAELIDLLIEINDAYDAIAGALDGLKDIEGTESVCALLEVALSEDSRKKEKE